MNSRGGLEEMKALILKLEDQRMLDREEFVRLIGWRAARLGRAAGSPEGQEGSPVGSQLPAPAVAGKSTGEAARNAAGKVTGEAARNVAGKSTGEAAQNVAGNITGETARNDTGEAARNDAGKVTGGAARNDTGKSTGQVAQNAAGGTDGEGEALDAFLFDRADRVRKAIYGNKVYIRGLIEFTNYCRNNCYYCGIRRGNGRASRYRLTEEEILACCRSGYELGFRTFVLQGGEDPYHTDDRVVKLVAAIRAEFPDCAITLSIGEKSRESYQRFYDAGADRYLLRHETADDAHYRRLHPPELSLENRRRCLWDLKEIGYQVGCGFMVGSPWQTVGCLARDLIFIGELEPHMVGIGPFIPHRDTPFAQCEGGTAEMTLFLLGVCRLMLPEVLLPATTALGTALADGREQGIKAGANVVMPNLSPGNVRKKYLLYDNKICTGDEAAESLQSLREHMAGIGYEVAVDRGDHKKYI
ncbi:[FeFe] hydrogenase H-cluster radical SAM maturase HydE [Bacilliculturomica massiliensis]|uniref:[FeFe] hydrogenase H-cluster radical SAM maturase HydE n=1 Tax=Bacilliculturomica massiliensis TaxID=1917867 RepID=UPI002ED1DFF1